VNTSHESRAQARIRRGRERLRGIVQARLGPGENIEALFPAQTGPRHGLGLVANLVRYWIIAVTDRNIVIVPMAARGLARLPREPFDMPEAPVRRGLFPVTIAGQAYDVAAGAFDLVAAAHAALRAGNAEPAKPAVTEPAAARSGLAPAAASASWYPDPGHRHQLRYWDGSAWTAYVADQGVQSVDPVKAS
jgi:hypothetical protein